MPIPSMNILAGRGCPHNCIFCSVNRTRVRRYPVEDIVNMIEKTTNKFNIRGVKFYDDSLTLSNSYVSALCDEIIRRKLDIVWFCDSRANINLDLLSLMYSAGCRYIAVGLETGSPKIQNNR
jgi:anaerobic magnesium-protoporphyrin IX monomethyl ester cyclase